MSVALAAIKQGKRKKELFDEFPSICARYPRFVTEASLLYAKSRDWKSIVNVFWGETGTGKTRKAFEEASTDLYVHSGGKWFDGYEGQENVIFDEFGGSDFALRYFLQLIDRYPMKVPVKGGFVEWVPKKIWITANYSPKDWYSSAKEEHQKALMRRIDRIVRFRRLSSVLEDPVSEHEHLVE